MKRKIENDLILVGAVLLVAVFVLAFLKLTAKKGNLVEVKVDGKLVCELPLNEDTTYDIKTEGGHINRLVIKDEKAYVSFADCRDKICQNHSAISNVGESIICLPHKVTVTVTSGG